MKIKEDDFIKLKKEITNIYNIKYIKIPLSFNETIYDLIEELGFVYNKSEVFPGDEFYYYTKEDKMYCLALFANDNYISFIEMENSEYD